MTPEQYAESLIEGHHCASGWKIKEAAKIAISDVQHTIEALEKASKINWCMEFEDQITYYQQALTYLNSKLK